MSAVFPHLTVLENVRVALQRALGPHVPVLAARLQPQHPQSARHGTAGGGGPRRLRRHGRGRAALRAQALAGDRHHACHGPGADAAGRADAGHGTRRRRPGHGADPARGRRAHGPHGGAQHAGGGEDRRHDHGAAARTHHRRAALCAGLEGPAGNRGLHGCGRVRASGCATRERGSAARQRTARLLRRVTHPARGRLQREPRRGGHAAGPQRRRAHHDPARRSSDWSASARAPC